MDWTTPFKFAFELFMFLLGWGLVTIIALASLAFVYAVVMAVVKTAKKRKDDEARSAIKNLINKGS